MLAELQNDCLVLFGSKAAVCLEHFCSIVIKARSWGIWKSFHDRSSSALKPSVMLGTAFHFCTSGNHFGDVLIDSIMDCRLKHLMCSGSRARELLKYVFSQTLSLTCEQSFMFLA